MQQIADDKSSLVVFRQSVFKLIRSAIFMGIFCLGCVWLINGGAVDTRGPLSVYLGWLCLPVLILVFTSVSSALLTGAKRTVLLDRLGFLDQRAFYEPILWTDVEVIDHRKGKQKLKVLVKPGTRKSLAMRPVMRINYLLDKMILQHAFVLRAADLDVSFEEFSRQFCDKATLGNPNVQVNYR